MVQRVTDRGDPRKYRTEIPNIVLLLGLTPYELTLYVHLKRTAGSDGVCWKSTATLARETGMSSGMVSKAKLSLQRVFKPLTIPLITVSDEVNQKGGKPNHSITVADIWPQNMAHFASAPAESKCDLLESNVRHAETSSTVPPLGGEHSGARAATPYEAATKMLLMRLVIDLPDEQSLSDSLAKIADSPERLITTLSNYLMAAGRGSITWNSSAMAAITTFATLAQVNGWASNASSLYEVAVHCMKLQVRQVNFTSSPREIRNKPSEEVTLEERTQEEPQRAAPRADTRGTRLPDDFCLNSSMREWAALNTPHVTLDVALAEFCDYWRGIPGQRGKKLDWPATWRNRMRELEGRARRNGNGNGTNQLGTYQTASERRNAATVRARERAAELRSLGDEPVESILRR